MLRMATFHSNMTGHWHGHGMFAHQSAHVFFAPSIIVRMGHHPQSELQSTEEEETLADKTLMCRGGKVALGSVLTHIISGMQQHDSVAMLEWNCENFQLTWVSSLVWH